MAEIEPTAKKLFEKMINGKTTTFPYVLKYLNRSTPPSIPDLPGGQGYNVNGFTPDLVQLFPEAAHVQSCLNNFGARRGLLETFLPPDAPIRDENREAFQALPAFVEREEGGCFYHEKSHCKKTDGIATECRMAQFAVWVLE